MSEDMELEIARLKQANAELISRGADYLQRLEKYRWIPVSERLPEDHDIYIACGIDFIGALYFDGEFVKEHFTGNEITHWMPLPEPPEDTNE